MGIKYTPSHEWFRVETDGEAIMGISDFAQSALGEVVYVDLPSEGASFKTKETICTLESVKAVGEAYAPLDCEVIAVNEADRRANTGQQLVHGGRLAGEGQVLWRPVRPDGPGRVRQAPGRHEGGVSRGARSPRCSFEAAALPVPV